MFTFAFISPITITIPLKEASPELNVIAKEEEERGTPVQVQLISLEFSLEFMKADILRTLATVVEQRAHISESVRFR